MKKNEANVRRQMFVLTAEEKRAGAFVLLAFALGLTTMQYRKTHPVGAASSFSTQSQQQQHTEKTATKPVRSAHRQPVPKAPTPESTSADEAEND